MSIYDWIDSNRKKIDSWIENICKNLELNDDDRYMWILDNDQLSSMAKNDGINI